MKLLTKWSVIWPTCVDKMIKLCYLANIKYISNIILLRIMLVLRRQGVYIYLFKYNRNVYNVRYYEISALNVANLVFLGRLKFRLYAHD
jgi:hypothetical protein